MQITIKQVAQKAGVSTATVSRVLNNSKKVDTKTRQKVLQAIKSLNYVPNSIARSLVSGKTNTLALIVPANEGFITADYFHKLISGISSAATKNGYNLLIKHQISERKIQQDILDFPVDGFVVISPTLDNVFVKHLEASRLPAVLINSRSPYLNWVDLDNVSAGVLLTEHLIKLGHKKIAFIGGVRNGQNTQDRYRGYQLGLAKHRIVFDHRLVFYGDYEKTKAYKIVKKLLNEKVAVTAIFASNDLMAIGAIQAIKEKKLNVPEDIAVVGFDDIDLAESFDPPITTIRQPFHKIGETAVQLLLDYIEKKPQKTKGIEFQGELIIRKSCGYSKIK